MKAVSIIALIIALASLAVSYTQWKQISELKKEISHSKGAESSFPKYHDATGIVKSISENRIVVDEDEIPGFMEAMVMTYEVEKPEQLKALKEKDKVKFKIKETEAKLTIVDIQKQ